MATRKSTQRKLERQLNKLLLTVCIILLALLVQKLGLLGSGSAGAAGGSSAAQAAGSQPSTAGDGVTVTVLDVGQGDSILVQAPGANLLIDGSTPSCGSTIYSYLKSQGITRLDYVINTHPHSDHVGGLAKVLKSLGKGNTGALWVTKYPSSLEPDTQSWPQLLQTAKAVGAAVTTPTPGTTCDLGGGAVLTVLGPAKTSESDMNDNSIVCRLDYKDASFLFTGDASAAMLEELARGGADLSADVLKVAHHGSNTGTDAALLRLVKPKAAAISCGKDNDYGHPHQEVLDLLEQNGVLCFRTDLQGNLVFYTDGANISVTPQRSYQQKKALLSAA